LKLIITLQFTSRLSVFPDFLKLRKKIFQHLLPSRQVIITTSQNYEYVLRYTFLPFFMFVSLVPWTKVLHFYCIFEEFTGYRYYPNRYCTIGLQIVTFWKIVFLTDIYIWFKNRHHDCTASIFTPLQRVYDFSQKFASEEDVSDPIKYIYSWSEDSHVRPSVWFYVKNSLRSKAIGMKPSQ